jgi:hypothetical protein
MIHDGTETWPLLQEASGTVSAIRIGRLNVLASMWISVANPPLERPRSLIGRPSF